MNQLTVIFLRLFRVLALSGMGISTAFSQSESLHFRHIDIENGLSSITVWSIVQDHQGYMWFGTNSGLNRFDGYNIRNYQYNPKDTLSLSNSRIIDLLVSENGDLWVGTAGGLNCYLRDMDQFLRIQPPAFKFNYVRCLTLDRQNNLWVGTTDGLYKFNVTEKSFFRDGTYADKPFAFFDKNIVNVVEDREGSLWICTTEGLFIMRNGSISGASAVGSHPVFASNEQFRDILQDADGNYWIGTESLDEGIYQFDSQFQLINSYSNVEGEEEPLAGNRIRVIKQLSDGKIWLGSFDGLTVYDPRQKMFSTYKANKYDPNSLSHNSIRDIFEDRDGGVWLATFRGGVNYYHPGFQKFHHEQAKVWTDNSLSDNLVSAFAQDRQGNLWIGTDGGLNFLDLRSKRYKKYLWENSSEGLLDNAIKSIAIDEDQNVWIGSQRGLSFLDLSTDRFTHFVHDPSRESSIGYGHVHSIYQDEKGTIWIGINGSGLHRYHALDNTFERFYRTENEPGESVDTHILSMVPYKNGLLWIGTEAGLELFDTENEYFTRSKMINDGVFEAVSTLNIPTLYQDGEGNLLIGTHENGLVAYNTLAGEIYVINDQRGLPNNTINGILEDEQGNIWISTNRGISQLMKPDNGWKDFSKADVVNFNLTDGLQGLQYYPNSKLKSRDGRLYFGGTNGYNSFFPEKVHKLTIQPDVVFTQIRFQQGPDLQSALKSNYLRDDTLLISHRQSSFSIEFAALNFFDPGQTKFAYQLQPVDPEWNDIGNERVVTYSKLPAGTYIFKVKATNNSLDFGNNISQLHITVLPPFWLTWWAYLIYFVIFIALLYLFFSIASKWGKLKSDLSWEHREREKENEMYQQRIKFFTDISHELRTPLTLILAPLERLTDQFTGSSRVKNQLLMIQRNGERMLQLINQLLDLRKMETGHLSLKAAKGDITMFVREVSLAFREAAALKNISFNVDVATAPVEVWYDRDKMEVILYNLLSNALKYTPAGGNVGLSVRQRLPTSASEKLIDEALPNGFVEIVVEDDGKGIPLEQLDRIFDRFYRSDQPDHSAQYGSGVGLEIVKKFVDLHKGEISVKSIESHAGQSGKTRFSIRLPLGSAHLRDSEIISDFKTSEDISIYKYAVAEPFSEEANSDQEIPGRKTKDEASTLLIVEDNEEVRRFIVSLFTPEFDVIQAADGQEGLKAALENIPDLVISDIMMPVMDGLALCKEIKSDQRTSHIPVILLTARTAITFQIQGVETGADDYVTKPFNAEYLKTRVKKLIAQRHSLRLRFSKGFTLIPEEVSVTSVDERLIKKAIEYINEHISDPDLGVERVALEVGLSRAHFYRKIKALTNLSAVEFIRQIKLEKAAQLLKTGKLNISEVRYAVGFQDAEYFRNTFKEYFNQTPSEYADQSNPE